jgi:ElaB/YqjD/DUF883 family membrane-anchored ribosome-binding protein
MAELNVTRGNDDTMPDASLTAGVPAERVVDSDHLLPEHTHASSPGVIAETDDPELARMQIEQTRARMSDTIDQIEGALLRKKETIEEKLDVMAPVRRKARENPYPIIGGVFVAGLILGLLTGGDDDDEDEKGPKPAVRRFAADFDRERAHGYHWEERATTWERRARRLMDLANRQEAELLELRGESVPVKRGRGRGLFGRGRRNRGYEEQTEQTYNERSYGTGGYVDTDTELEVNVHAEDVGYARPRSGGYDGMPLHDADSYPPRDEDLGGGYGYGRDPLPSPI